MHVFLTSGVLETLKPKVLLGLGRCTVTGLQASGVLPHLVHAAGLRDVRDRLESTEERILNQLQMLPIRAADEILTRVAVEGPQVITMNQMEYIFNGFRTEMQQENIRVIAAAQAASTPTPATNTPPQCWWKTWNWGGRFRFVPDGFEFPKRASAKIIWDLYFMGNVTEGIRPYCYVSKCLRNDTERCLLRKAKVVVEYIASQAVGDINTCNIMSNDALSDTFANGWRIVRSRFTTDRADLTYTTLVNRISVLIEEDNEVNMEYL